MKRAILILALRCAKAVGLFALARRLTACDLRILCYHGAEIADESRLKPGLFMTARTFDKRMAFLARAGYPVLGLGEALSRLTTGELPPCATVITIDDGWYGTYKWMTPVLEEHGFPATLYVATYYVENPYQVFNVAADYVLRTGEREVIDLVDLVPQLEGRFDLRLVPERVRACARIVEYAESLDGAAPRQELFRRLCDYCGVDWRPIESARVFTFATPEELREMQRRGVDLQLHTHRHRFGGEGLSSVRKEIEDNRTALARITREPLRHFCYPSGEYLPEQVPWLERLGIESATTVKSGFVRRGRSRYELGRFLDSEKWTELEFEAELSGCFELARRCGFNA